jgi:hypothetical protein
MLVNSDCIPFTMVEKLLVVVEREFVVDEAIAFTVFADRLVTFKLVIVAEVRVAFVPNKLTVLVVVAFVVEALDTRKLDVLPKRVDMVADNIDARVAVRFDVKEFVDEAVVAKRLVLVLLVLVELVEERLLANRVLKKPDMNEAIPPVMLVTVVEAKVVDPAERLVMFELTTVSLVIEALLAKSDDEVDLVNEALVANRFVEVELVIVALLVDTDAGLKLVTFKLVIVAEVRVALLDERLARFEVPVAFRLVVLRVAN